MRPYLLAGLTAVFTSIGAAGGIVAPLYVGNAVPVLDPWGNPMAGSNDPALADQRARVEIRFAPDGIAFPPAVDGSPHPLNPLLDSTNGVAGIGQNTSAADSGLFGVALSERPPAGTRIFARVFNAPTIEEATFYADSTPVAVPAQGHTLTLVFGPTLPLDPNDDDGDGLNNSWERLLGTDPTNPDSDGDGMSDYEEWRAGTDPLDAKSNLSFREVAREQGTPGPLDATDVTTIRVVWQAVPGKTYQLQHAAMLADGHEFTDIGGEMLAADDESEVEMWIEIPADQRMGIFRVRLVTE